MQATEDIAGIETKSGFMLLCAACRQLEVLAKKVAAPSYQEKVPKNVQELDAAKRDKLREELDTIANARQNFEKLL